MQFLLEPVAGDLAEDGRDVVVQFLHHDGEPQFVVRCREDLVEHEIFHEGARDLGRRGGRAEIEGMLLFADELVVDAVAQLVGDGQDVVQFSGVVQEDIRGLDQEMMHAEGAAVLALPGVGVDLSVLDEPRKDIAEPAVEFIHHPVDKVY